MGILYTMAWRMASDFVVFVPLISSEPMRGHFAHPHVEAIVTRLLHDGPPESYLDPSRETTGVVQEASHVGTSTAFDAWEVPKEDLNRKMLRAVWEATQRSTREDWQEWIRRLSVQMLRGSPSASMRACAALAQQYQPLARQLFNATFLSCWRELGVDGYQESLVKCLETALDAEQMSLEVLQPLLNLAEFMELADKPLPIDIRKLGALAEKCHAYAKALHYREVEFQSYPADTIEALISINNQLQQPEAAKGILTYAWQNYQARVLDRVGPFQYFSIDLFLLLVHGQVELKESWYEKLQRWDDARDAYERKQREDPDNFMWTLGRMRCQHALGEWGSLCQLVREKWRSHHLEDDELRAEVAKLAAGAAWNLRLWDEMEHYCASIPKGSFALNFFRAILAMHSNHYRAAQVHIDEARWQLDSEFTASVGESYRRAYRGMIRVQQLSELEEMLQHKQEPTVMPLSLLVSMWRGRLAQVLTALRLAVMPKSARHLSLPQHPNPRPIQPDLSVPGSVRFRCLARDVICTVSRRATGTGRAHMAQILLALSKVREERHQPQSTHPDFGRQPRSHAGRRVASSAASGGVCLHQAVVG